MAQPRAKQEKWARGKGAMLKGTWWEEYRMTRNDGQHLRKASERSWRAEAQKKAREHRELHQALKKLKGRVERVGLQSATRIG